MTSPKLTPQQDAQIVDSLNNSDVTKAELARTYGVSPRSIDRAIDRHAKANAVQIKPVQTPAVSLSPGDCVYVDESMTKETVNAICKAFIDAGTMGGAINPWVVGDDGGYLGWDMRDNELYSFPDMKIGIHGELIFNNVLSVEQVLGTVGTQTEDNTKEEEHKPSYSFMMSDSSITIWADEEQETITKSHPEFKTISDLIYESHGSPEALEMAFTEISKKAQLQVLTRGKIEIDPINARVTYMNHPIPLELMDRIVKAAQSGQDDRLNDLVEFTKRMYQNPYQKVISELYSFLEACDIAIDPEGYVVAYKVVRGDYTDIFTGTFDNSIGAVCEMPRAFVDNDSKRTCSNGLHVCSKAYIPFFSSTPGCRIVKVKVDPADFVSIPDEYWGVDEDGRVKAKARVCKYEVIEDVTDEIKRDMI